MKQKQYNDKESRCISVRRFYLQSNFLHSKDKVLKGCLFYMLTQPRLVEIFFNLSAFVLVDTIDICYLYHSTEANELFILWWSCISEWWAWCSWRDGRSRQHRRDGNVDWNKLISVVINCLPLWLSTYLLFIEDVYESEKNFKIKQN